MKILGIDPSNVHSAYCLVDTKDMHPIEFGIIDNQEMIKNIKRIKEECGENEIIHFVIEGMQNQGMPVGNTVFDTVLLIGRFIEHAIFNSYDKIIMIYRRDEKLCICNNTRAKDSNIRQALINKYGEVGIKKNQGFFYGFKKDCWAAFAVIETYHEFFEGRYEIKEKDLIIF